MADHGVRVEVTALRGIGTEFDRISQRVERQAAIRFGFGAEVAGRSHVAAGAAVRRSLDRQLLHVRLWSRAAAEIGIGLCTSVDRYLAADMAVGAGID